MVLILLVGWVVGWSVKANSASVAVEVEVVMSSILHQNFIKNISKHQNDIKMSLKCHQNCWVRDGFRLLRGLVSELILNLKETV